MKHRGVSIVTVYTEELRCVGNDPSKWRNVRVKAGVSPVGVNYPMTLDEAKQSVDKLIEDVMRCCGVDERAAVKLINES